MENKKKLYSSQYYKALFVLLFFMVLSMVLCIFSGNSYAMTEEDLTEFIEKVLLTEPYKTDMTKTAEQYVEKIISNFDITQYPYVFCSYYPKNGKVVKFFFDNVPLHASYSGSLYWKAEQEPGERI